MSNRKFVVPRTTILTGKPVIYFVAAVAIAASAVAPIRADAQTAADVYKKMTDVYANAKSYQGTISRVESGKTADGKPATQTVTVKVSYKAPNKYLVNNVRAVSVGGKSQSTDQTMVTDGKSLYMFSAVKKVYQRGQVQNQNILSKFFALLTPANGFSLLPNATVNGRAAYVLKPNLPKNGTPTDIANAKKVTVTIMIDKANYQFLKMSIESPNAHLTQSVSGQTVNGTVSDRLFAWAPPASYKEVKPQAAPTGGPTAPGRPVGQ